MSSRCRREIARHDVGYSGRFCKLLGFDLVAHRGNRLGRRTDEGDARLFERSSKAFALGKEAIARVDRLGSRCFAGIDDEFRSKIGFACRRRTETDRFVGLFDMRRIGVGIGINSDRLDPHAARSADHSARNLAAVGNQNLFEHFSISRPSSAV